jgi:hypothetical protein
MKIWLFCTAVATVVISVSPRSQGGLDAATLKLYGGTYSAECSNAAAPHLRVVADALIFEQGSRRVTGRNVQSIPSYFGAGSPPDFEFAFDSEVIKGVSLTFLGYGDKAGHYITLDGHPRVAATIGKTVFGQKYRRCGDGGREAARPVPADRDAGPPTGGPWTLLADSRFKAAYYAALGPRTKGDWLGRLEGPATPLRRMTIGGQEFTVASVCKDHDCGDNNAVLLYSTAQRVVFAKILDRRRSIVLGAPPPQILAALDRLWTAEYGRRQ